jgi:hypothetical protein
MMVFSPQIYGVAFIEKFIWESGFLNVWTFVTNELTN